MYTLVSSRKSKILINVVSLILLLVKYSSILVMTSLSLSKKTQETSDSHVVVVDVTIFQHAVREAGDPF